MQVKMLTISAGPSGARHPGDIVRVGEAEAAALIAGGYAVELDSASKDEACLPPGPEEMETAALPAPPEKAVTKGRKGK